MLAERVGEWFQQAEQRGMARGMQQGMARGIQQGMQQGIQQGMQQGMQQGRLQGEGAALERILTRRFGPLTDDARARLAGASQPQIEAWLDRAIDAPDLGAVFVSLD